jgi:hypothetical protein
MPLLKKKDGWHWGSKGPFSTKAQALAVARAAFAHGYKGESTPMPSLNENVKVSQAKNG